jgi:hypothetical protein
MVVVFRVAPEWTPFVMGVLFSSHFLPYAWMYRSAGYASLAIATTVVLTVGVVVTGSPMFTLAPVLTAACYAGSLVLLTREVLRSTHDKSVTA